MEWTIVLVALLSMFGLGVLVGWLLRGDTKSETSVTLAADIREKKSQLALLTLRELVDVVTVIPWQDNHEDVEHSVERAAKIINRLRLLQEENQK